MWRLPEGSRSFFDFELLTGKPEVFLGAEKAQEIPPVLFI